MSTNITACCQRTGAFEALICGPITITLHCFRYFVNGCAPRHRPILAGQWDGDELSVTTPLAVTYARHGAHDHDGDFQIAESCGGCVMTDAPVETHVIEWNGIRIAVRYCRNWLDFYEEHLRLSACPS